MGERPTPPEATAEMKYAELRPPVQDHVRNLRTQLFELARKYGKKDPNDLRELVEHGDIPMEDVERITSLMLAMTESFKDDRLSKEAVEGVENQLELWSELVDAVDETLRVETGREWIHGTLNSARMARMFRAIIDRDPAAAAKRIEAIGPQIVNVRSFSEALVPVCAEAGDFAHAHEAAERLDTIFDRELAFEVIARAAIERGNADHVIASFGGLDERKRERISLDAVHAFLFAHHDPASARRFISRVGLHWSGKAAAEFARYAEEPGVDSSGLLKTAREMIRDIDLSYCSEEGRLGYVTAFALLNDGSEVRRVVALAKQRDLLTKNTVKIVEALVAGRQFDLARAFVGKAMSLSATKSSAYRAIARAETAAGVDPAQSIALAEGTFKFPQHETDAHVIDAATAYVAVGKDDQLVAALRRIDLDDVGIMRGTHGETMRAELMRAMAMRPKQSLGAIDRFLWARAQELLSGIPAGMAYLELAEAEARAGIDPRPAVNEALRLSNGFGPELQFKLGLPVCEAGQRLGCEMSAGWKSALRGAKSFQPEQSLPRLAVARIEYGLSIGDELQAIDSLTGTGTIRADARSEVAHAIFLRATASINLLPPAEQRRLRRKFSIMEPKES